MSTRRQLLGAGSALGLLALAGCATTTRSPTTARVLVVGGGFGGATAAKYLRLLSDRRLEVILVEPLPALVSCPESNLLLGGTRTLAALTRGYDALAGVHGVRVVRDRVARVDTGAKTALLDSGATLSYDRLVLSPGIDFRWDEVEGLRTAHDAGIALHAWKAGPETTALRAQLEAMPDGGVCAITIPEAPYRCPPGPYERACQVASYFKTAKPRAKVLVLDANPEIVSKGALFRQVWADEYPGMVEYRAQHRLTGVDGATRTLRFEVQDAVTADVINVLPPQRAGAIAVQTGLANSNGRWVNVDYLTFAATAARDVHVLGDAIQVAPAMPKSAHMANAQAKVAAAAIVAELSGRAPNAHPMLSNTCYSHVDATRAVHVASVHEYNETQRTYLAVAGAGGLSTGPSELEGRYAQYWAQGIWADTLG